MCEVRAGLFQLNEKTIKEWGIQAETMRNACREFAAACCKIWDIVKKRFKDFLLTLRKYFTLNFKRLARIKSRMAKQRILANNTNNWRKLHRLPLARSSC